MENLSVSHGTALVRFLNNVFRMTTTTLSPAFAVRNMYRDFKHAFITGELQKNPIGFVRDYAGGMVTAFMGTFAKNSESARLLNEAIDAGMGFGFGGTLRSFGKGTGLTFPSTGNKVWKLVTKPFDVVERVNAAIELAPRMAIYKRAKAAGRGVEDAAIMAKTGTIDYNQAGTWGRIANAWVPFLNARIQGKTTFWRAMADRPGQTIAKLTVAEVLPWLATYAINEAYHPQEHDEIPADVKEQYHVLVVGGGKDARTGEAAPTYIPFPKGEMGPVTNVLEYMLSRHKRMDPDAHWDLVQQVLHDFVSPIQFMHEGQGSIAQLAAGLAPPQAVALVEASANFVARQGRALIPRRAIRDGQVVNLQEVPPAFQYTDETPDVWKWIGRQMGVSPIKLQHIAGGFGGPFGKYASPTQFWEYVKRAVVQTRGGAADDRQFEVIEEAQRQLSEAKDEIRRMQGTDPMGTMAQQAMWNVAVYSLADDLADRGASAAEVGKFLERYTLTDPEVTTLEDPGSQVSPVGRAVGMRAFDEIMDPERVPAAAPGGGGRNFKGFLAGGQPQAPAPADRKSFKGFLAGSAKP